MAMLRKLSGGIELWSGALKFKLISPQPYDTDGKLQIEMKNKSAPHFIIFLSLEEGHELVAQLNTAQKARMVALANTVRAGFEEINSLKKQLKELKEKSK